MPAKALPIYRLPIKSATRIGTVRVVIDRHGQWYVDGSKVIEVVTGATHTTIKLANGRDFYVLTKEYETL